MTFSYLSRHNLWTSVSKDMSRSNKKMMSYILQFSCNLPTDWGIISHGILQCLRCMNLVCSWWAINYQAQHITYKHIFGKPVPHVTWEMFYVICKMSHAKCIIWNAKYILCNANTSYSMPICHEPCALGHAKCFM